VPGLGSLETAKEILTEVFGARLGEVKERSCQESARKGGGDF
jgi:hypothetical protein